MAAPLFVFGFPRSGTTLLRAVLGAHPDVDLRNEPEIFQTWFATRPAAVTDPVVGAELLDALGSSGMSRGHLAALPAEVVASAAAAAFTCFADAYEALLPRPDAPTWGEKGINTPFVLGAVAAAYPGARFLHLVRDPRDAIASRYRKGGGEGSVLAERWASRSRTARSAARYITVQGGRWVRYVRTAEEAAASVDPDRWRTIRYEDVVADPPAAIARLCDWLDIAFVPAMLDPASRADDPVLASARGRATHGRLSEGIGADPPGVAMAGPFAHAVEVVSGPAMHGFGYLPVARSSALSRATVAVVVARERRRCASPT